jgi:hypothetical protein
MRQLVLSQQEIPYIIDNKKMNGVEEIVAILEIA